MNNDFFDELDKKNNNDKNDSIIISKKIDKKKLCEINSIANIWFVISIILIVLYVIVFVLSLFIEDITLVIILLTSFIPCYLLILTIREIIQILHDIRLELYRKRM